MINYTFIISINVHEKPDFLLKQLDNIKNHINYSYAVVLNCNNHMYKLLKDIVLPFNIYINDNIIEKKRCTGTLAQGILSNIRYSIKNFNFDYFIILSSRTFFYNIININNLISQQIFCNEDIEEFKQTRAKSNDIEKLHTIYDMSYWKPFHFTSKLVEYYYNNNGLIYGSPHEGLTFTSNVAFNIINFLDNHKDIEDDIYKLNSPAEEFALQTIAMNHINEDNREYGFLDIGNGTDTQHVPPTVMNKYTYKVNRE